MSNWGTLLSAVGQTVEFIGMVWLIVSAWRAAKPSPSYADFLDIRKLVHSGGFGAAAVTIAVGLLTAVVGGWMQALS